jgi:8-amino-7-oxononanoate synthase
MAVDFSGNDYLGLLYNKESIEAGRKAAKIYGSGSSGSRLLSGNKAIFEEFESQIAADKNFESALILNSGFIANASTTQALSIPDGVLIFDKLNHASMYFGIDPTRAKLVRYKHLNYDELEDILKKYVDCKNKIIFSETVFGMDGDIADLRALSYLSQKYGALLFLDEAHATGLYGKNGLGLSTDFEFDPSKTLVMGTFSKALASSGAYIACSRLLKDYLIQKSKGFIYSTALSPFCIGAAQYNWRLTKTLENERRRVLELAGVLREKISDLGYNTIGAETNIIPIIFEKMNDALSVNQKLAERGIIASAIRPPTSPTPRIRLAVTAAHSESDLERLLEALK